MTNYKNLEVWKKSMALVDTIYDLLKSYPKDEQFALTSQTKRAAISIPSNIAEGLGRNYKKETIQFLHISRGSMFELDTLLSVALTAGMIVEQQFNEISELLQECMKILNGFIQYVEKSKLR